MLKKIPGFSPARTGTEARTHRGALAREAHTSGFFSLRSIQRTQAGNYLYSVPVLDDVEACNHFSPITLWKLGSEFGRKEFEYGLREIGPLIVFGEDGDVIDPDLVQQFHRTITEDGMVSLWYLSTPVNSTELSRNHRKPTPDLPEYLFEQNRQDGFTVLYIKNDEAGDMLLEMLEERRHMAIERLLGKDKGTHIIPPIRMGEGNKAAARFKVANHISEKMLLPNRTNLAMGGFPTTDCLRMLAGGLTPDDLDKAGPIAIPGLMPLVMFYESEADAPEGEELAEYLRDEFMTADLDATFGYIAQRGAGAGYIPLPDSLHLDGIMESMREKGFYLLPIALPISNPRRFFIRDYFKRKGVFIYYT